MIQDLMMDSCTSKLYCECGFDSRQHLEDYVSDKPDMVFMEDFVKFPIENCKNIFTEGHIRGDIVIDLSLGSLVHQLYSACDFFKHIIVLKVRDRCIMELKRWVDSRTGAFSWGHAAKLYADIEGESDKLQEKEEKMRLAIQQVMKCDLGKENMMDPIVLPLADCIITAWFLDAISKDQDEYIRYLKKVSGLLKLGGHIILVGDLDTTYYIIGKHKFHFLNYDEEFVRKALVEAGFKVDYCKVKKRTAVSDLLDYKAIIFVAAHKEREVKP
ncbi:nicotinamide N-methyltransferase-like [Phyllobates terribilis]|uniref:nicotinamide N-methyltransferase-like n=1 Tax=Phyllobates terribilis TaxID=111132 RepID=UPI003CCAF194